MSSKDKCWDPFSVSIVTSYEQRSQAFGVRPLWSAEKLLWSTKDLRIVASSRGSSSVSSSQPLILNRTNRSGIIHSGGVIGGLKQAGEWKLDARFYRESLIKRIETIADYRNRISLYNRDAAELLGILFTSLPTKSLLYLDPPYYVKGKRRLYANYYEHSDHAQIAKLLAVAKHSWLVSYDDAPEVRALYRGYRRRAYGVPYTAHERYQGREIIFFSHGLTLPTTRNVKTTKPEALRPMPEVPRLRSLRLRSLRLRSG